MKPKVRELIPLATLGSLEFEFEEGDTFDATPLWNNPPLALEELDGVKPFYPAKVARIFELTALTIRVSVNGATVTDPRALPVGLQSDLANWLQLHPTWETMDPTAGKSLEELEKN